MLIVSHRQFDESALSFTKNSCLSNSKFVDDFPAVIVVSPTLKAAKSTRKASVHMHELLALKLVALSVICCPERG